MRGDSGGDAESWRLNYSRLLIRDCLDSGYRVQLDGGKIRFIPLHKNVKRLKRELRWWIKREFAAQVRRVLRQPLSAATATGGPTTTRKEAAHKNRAGHIKVS